jgi:hypothetical protein
VKTAKPEAAECDLVGAGFLEEGRGSREVLGDAIAGRVQSAQVGAAKLVAAIA